MDEDLGYYELEALVGQGAGNIAARNLRYHTWLTETETDAARAMQPSLRSAWVLVETWNNRTTVWESPAGDRKATVTAEGEIRIERSWGSD